MKATKSNEPNGTVPGKGMILKSYIFYLLLVTLIEDGNCSRRVPAFILSPSSPAIALQLRATNGEEKSSMMSRNQLMHAMIRVPDVNATIDFWTSQGAKVHSYRKTSTAETAFIGFGKEGEGYFSLEITALREGTPFQLGNAIQYFGLSMLLGMDLRSAAAGKQGPAGRNQDPVGLEIRPVASAPGDLFSRVCLGTIPQDDILSKTADFYGGLGMELVAGDDTLICLRYTGKQEARTGVATTLVFEKMQNDLEPGNCFDHLAVSTVNVDAAATLLRASLENPDKMIFMEPKPMFGTKIMGVYDPNGFKVYLVERDSS